MQPSCGIGDVRDSEEVWGGRTSKVELYLGLVAYNFSTQRPEARRSLQVQGQPAFQNETQSQNQNERNSYLCTRGYVPVRHLVFTGQAGSPVFGYVIAWKCLEGYCVVWWEPYPSEDGEG